MITVCLLAALAMPVNIVPAVPESTIVVLVGTGMPRPDTAAGGPATAVIVGTRVFLFDAGPGIERQLARARLPIAGVTALFITHLHTDHTLGYPDLIFTSWVMGRRTPLRVYGPHGLRAMTNHLLAAYAEDIAVRTTGLEHQSRGGYRVAATEIAPGIVYDSGGVRVTAIPVPHGSWKEAYGYRIDTPTRTVVISGDTRPSEALARAAAGVDVLVHEAYPEGEPTASTREGVDWPRYMREFHTSDLELGALAARSQPHLLVLTHLVRRAASDSAMLARVREGGFTGRAVIGHDLERY